MDAKKLLQTVYATGKRMYDAKLFGRGPFNQTEMQMIGEILANRERGKRIIDRLLLFGFALRSRHGFLLIRI